jgi:hypothetical protein
MVGRFSLYAAAFFKSTYPMRPGPH